MRTPKERTPTFVGCSMSLQGICQALKESPEYKFGWLQGVRKSLKGNKIWVLRFRMELIRAAA